MSHDSDYLQHFCLQFYLQQFRYVLKSKTKCKSIVDEGWEMVESDQPFLSKPWNPTPVCLFTLFFCFIFLHSRLPPPKKSIEYHYKSGMSVGQSRFGGPGLLRHWLWRGRRIEHWVASRATDGGRWRHRGKPRGRVCVQTALTDTFMPQIWLCHDFPRSIERGKY